MALPAQPDAVSAWHTIRGELQRIVSDSAFEIWLAPVELESFDGNLLLLRAPCAAADPRPRQAMPIGRGDKPITAEAL